MGFKDGADHFDGGATGFGVAEWGTVFFDGGDEIESGGEVAADLFAEVGDRFFGGKAVAVDGLPGLGGGAGIEGAAATQMGERFGVDAEVDDALGANELNAETSVARAGVLHGVEEQGEPAFHLEASMGFIAGAGIWYDDTSTLLASNATFTGTSRDATVTATATAFANAATYAMEVRVSAESDQSGTLWLETSRDNSNWRRAKSVATAAVTGGGQFAEIVHRPSWRYWRVGFTNGATLQTRLTVGSIAIAA